jgi:hypothetical protein
MQILPKKNPRKVRNDSNTQTQSSSTDRAQRELYIAETTDREQSYIYN